MNSKKLENVTDQECYEIAVLDGWKTVWEADRGGIGTVDEEELIGRGREIVNGEIGGGWINSDRINLYLKSKGYESLPLS